MNRIWLACVLALLSICAMAAQFRVKIVDATTKKPLQGVKVLGWFSNDNGWKAWTESAPEYVDNGVTDKNGKCWLAGKTNTGKVGFIVKEPPLGYYPSPNVRLQLPHTMFGNLSGRVTDGPEELLQLNRIENPVPLFVKKAKGKFNVDWPKEDDGGTNAVLRYDLVVGDWLPPEGKGLYADLTIHAKMEASRYVYEWLRIDGSKGSRTVRFFDVVDEIKFPGKGNGIARWNMTKNTGLLIRIAELDGYEQAISLRNGRKKKIVGPNVFYEDYTDTDEDLCYMFRIRSKFDKEGNLKEAYYGKIYGDFQLLGNWKNGYNGVSFLYYLNPTPLDRNLEWDMKNNLCPNPGSVGREP